MATSPPYAGSPPGGSGTGTPISRKRPALPSHISASSKRRKPSTAGPSHLRQTSFPPEEAYNNDARSPSVDSAAIGTPSIISGTGAGGKRGKRAATGSVVAGGSVVGSKVNGTGGTRGSRGVSGSAVNGGHGNNAAGNDDDEPEEDDEDGNAAAHNLQSEEQSAADHRRRQEEAARLLRSSFDTRQSTVFEMFHVVGRGRMTKRIQKLANTTISQSLSNAPVNCISSYLKVFLGDVIEEARRVQLEWQAVEDKRPDGSAVADDADLRERTKEEWRGPLLPDHLREAIRRMKKDRVGGAGGFQGVSMAGTVRTAPKMGGRRLFR